MKDSMLRYIRELEQINDDLERGKRLAMAITLVTCVICVNCDVEGVK